MAASMDSPLRVVKRPWRIKAGQGIKLKTLTAHRMLTTLGILISLVLALGALVSCGLDDQGAASNAPSTTRPAETSSTSQSRESTVRPAETTASPANEPPNLEAPNIAKAVAT